MRNLKSPRQIIRRYCLHCTGGNPNEVELCNGGPGEAFAAVAAGYHNCAFHPYRFSRKVPPIKIMRQFCLQCMGGSPGMVRECETEDCLIHPFRFGKNPGRAGQGQSAEVMARARAKKRAMSKEKGGQNQRSLPGIGEPTGRVVSRKKGAKNEK